VKDIVTNLLEIIVNERREDLIQVYPFLPDNVRRILINYVKLRESGNVNDAVKEVSKEIDLIFSRVYSVLKKIAQQVQA